MWTAGQAEAAILGASRGMGGLGIAALAGVAEEASKLAVVFLVSVLARREFDDPMDGVVYGSLAGLGAALEESLAYRRMWPSALVPAGELVRLWAHVVLGGIVGFPLGFWRGAPRRSAIGTLLALSVVACLHFGWDAVVLSVREGAAPRPTQILAGIALMLGSLTLYGRLVVIASASSRHQFAPESAARLWGWPFGGSRGRGPA
jgi:RsiW-degrading membrane proteinase PrsW (M82 family)